MVDQPLAQPRRGTFAQDRGEQLERVAILGSWLRDVPGDQRGRDRGQRIDDLVLDRGRLLGLGRVGPGVVGPARDRGVVLLDQRARGSRVEVADDHQRRVVGHVVAGEEVLERFHRRVREVLHRAVDRVRVLPARVGGRWPVEQDRLHEGLVLLLLANLFFDHVLLVGQRFFGDGQRGHAIGLEPEHALEVIRGDRLVVVGPIGLGVAVERPAGPVDVPGVGALGHLGRAVEHHVLEQMREPGEALLLLRRADLVRDVRGHDRRAVVLAQDHLQAVVEREPPRGPSAAAAPSRPVDDGHNNAATQGRASGNLDMRGTSSGDTVGAPVSRHKAQPAIPMTRPRTRWFQGADRYLPRLARSWPPGPPGTPRVLMPARAVCCLSCVHAHAPPASHPRPALHPRRMRRRRQEGRQEGRGGQEGRRDGRRQGRRAQGRQAAGAGDGGGEDTGAEGQGGRARGTRRQPAGDPGGVEGRGRAGRRGQLVGRRHGAGAARQRARRGQGRAGGAEDPGRAGGAGEQGRRRAVPHQRRAGDLERRADLRWRQRPGVQGLRQGEAEPRRPAHRAAAQGPSGPRHRLRGRRPHGPEARRAEARADRRRHRLRPRRRDQRARQGGPRHHQQDRQEVDDRRGGDDARHARRDRPGPQPQATRQRARLRRRRAGARRPRRPPPRHRPRPRQDRGQHV